MAQINIETFFDNEAKKIVDKREKSIDIHESNIKAAGNEVEIAVREWLNRMVPDLVSIGHGHLIDSNSQISPEIDCILRDQKYLPTLFTTADRTEYTPIDSVFAYGEIKSRYYKSSDPIQKFVETKKEIREEMAHTLVENTAQDGISNDSLLQHLLLESSQKYLNKLYTFMFFVNSGDADNEGLKDIYARTEDRYLPDIAVFLDRYVIVKCTNDSSFQIHRYGELAPPHAEWMFVPAPNEGKNLGLLYYCLLNHIKESHLRPPDLTDCLSDLLSRSKSSVTALDPKKPKQQTE